MRVSPQILFEEVAEALGEHQNGVLLETGNLPKVQLGMDDYLFGPFRLWTRLFKMKSARDNCLRFNVSRVKKVVFLLVSIYAHEQDVDGDPE